tara:strand:+ start:227 stop:619 length:393 start_codon:yes stop_codon:yes gene_type:complete
MYVEFVHQRMACVRPGDPKGLRNEVFRIQGYLVYFNEEWYDATIDWFCIFNHQMVAEALKTRNYVLIEKIREAYTQWFTEVELCGVYNWKILPCFQQSFRVQLGKINSYIDAFDFPRIVNKLDCFFQARV